MRDALLGITVKDRDYVVVGATAEQLVDQGFRQVGRDFPVFLHPRSNDEYALARTERKSGRGYGGFTVWADPKVTLEQDLKRRDLTINAIAKSPDGRLIDPFNGRGDLAAGILRHVSEAFTEDPLRVLRVARFMARFANRGFTIAPETFALMTRMSHAGELDALNGERVWMEISRALGEPRPDAFIQTLRDCDALKWVLPEVDALFGVPQHPRYHPEIDTGIHTIMAIRQAALLSNDLEVRFSALLHDLGKGLTSKEELPRHVGHEARGVAPVNAVCERLRVPKRCQRIAVMVCRDHLKMHRLMDMRPGAVLRVLKHLDALRNPQFVDWFALACEADSRGRTGREEIDYPQRALLLRYRDALCDVDLGDVADGRMADDIPREVERRQLNALLKVKQQATHN